MRQLTKISVGAALLLVSLELAAALLVGYLVAKVLSGRGAKEQGVLRSLVFEIRSYRVHLHHWLWSAGLICAALLFNFSLVAPSLFYGFFGGVMMQGILGYEDWRQIIWRRT